MLSSFTCMPHCSRIARPVEWIAKSALLVFGFALLSATLHPIEAQDDLGLMREGIPIIAAQPQNQTVRGGTNTTLSVTATGKTPLEYQWKKDDSDIPGATTNNYSISAPRPGDAGSYRVVVTNTVGSVTSKAATLSIFNMDGPLRVDADNPRYFTDNSGKPIFLTGSHTWDNLQDFSLFPVFDYPAYLDFLTERGHNFIRLWNLDEPYLPVMTKPKGYTSPVTFSRTGPGNAADGKLKFDLAQFDQAYFDRMRARVIAARERGIYVSIMLFDGFWINGAGGTGFRYSFYNPANNVNRFSIVKNDVYTMNNPRWVALMDAYVKKVVDTVNDLDNVLYEVINEAPPSSKAWQYHIIERIRSYEATMPKQHPVGMTGYDFLGSDATANADMLASPADWISLSGRSGTTYKTDVTEAPATKVSILDTDHIWGLDPAGDDSHWVWRSLMRGHNPIYMDPYTRFGSSLPDTAIQAAMGYARALAERINLAHMVPLKASTSTGHALVHRDTQYLIYQPEKSSFTVILPAQMFHYEWINPVTGGITDAGTIQATAGDNSFVPPAGYTSGALLHLTLAPQPSLGDFPPQTTPSPL